MVQVGTTLVVIGLVCSALAPNVFILYLTHGVIAGQFKHDLLSILPMGDLSAALLLTEVAHALLSKIKRK